ncbi:ribonuclease III [Candidatus Aerophobetes bacterium]|uniref:Ribonuclease 3 n=1 Tax=Aerophobetes bacterium TaxID=2030807 RepID=A0A662DMW9_UNCAE|nr:MAG: ribonuclease III [Candidatus Aerophobetes bacterium]
MIDPSRVKDLNNFQEKIGIRWKNIRLLDQALTHSSYAKSSIQPACDNERIEFLGDAVLELVISDYLFRKFSYLDEGGLSRMRSAVVSEESLANHARKMGLGDYILVGKDQEQIRLQDAILADAYEAVIGALYLDQGLKAAKKFILNFFIKEENLLSKTKDFKSLLQEYSQSVYKKLPRYKLVQEEGPDHKKMFKVKVEINGKTLGEGWGPSKKKAEKIAAEKAWEKINTEENSK